MDEFVDRFCLWLMQQPDVAGVERVDPALAAAIGDIAANLPPGWDIGQGWVGFYLAGTPVSVAFSITE